MISIVDRSGHHWCESEDDKLREMLADGKDYSAIGIILKRRESTVRQRASKLKATPVKGHEKWPDDDKVTLINMMKDRKKLPEIAQHLNRSVESVRSFCNRHDIRAFNINSVNWQAKLTGKTPSGSDTHKCLRCRNDFVHSGKGNHICPGCTSSKTEEVRGLPEYYVGRAI